MADDITLTPEQASELLGRVYALLNQDFPTLNLTVRYMLMALAKLSPDFKREFLAALEADVPADGEQRTIRNRVRDIVKGTFDDVNKSPFDD